MDKPIELTFPGQVDFQTLKLISSNGVVVDLNDYLVEFNLYEDIFKNFLHGQIMINDSNNILTRLPIIGDEILIVRFGTPTLEAYIQKYFHVYSVTDQKTVGDNNTQTYILHFCSAEAILDANLVVYDPFSGNVSEVAKKIFETYLFTEKYIKYTENSIEVDENKKSAFNFTETQNKIKFISPGWNPSKCLNWLCTKAIPREGKACDFLFWESNVGFFFASIEDLIIEADKENKMAGEYFYVPPGTRETSDVYEKMFMAESFDVVSFADNLENFTNGYFSNKLITYDPLTKSYASVEYDYPNNYDKFRHTEGDASVPMFPREIFRNPGAYAKIYPTNSKLFSGVRDNYPEKMKDIFGNRTSKINELNNFKINITVHGRTDLYAGAMIKFNYPETLAHNTSAETGLDPLYSGNYIVSAIRHKINYRTHVMVMELIKTSFADKLQPAGFSSTII